MLVSKFVRGIKKDVPETTFVDAGSVKASKNQRTVWVERGL